MVRTLQEFLKCLGYRKQIATNVSHEFDLLIMQISKSKGQAILTCGTPALTFAPFRLDLYIIPSTLTLATENRGY